MITATILAKNAQKHIEEVLSALKNFDEVVLLDNGSTDGTTEIASRFSNVKIYTLDSFEGFGKAHQKMEELARNDWILSIDSDEVLSYEAEAEIFSMKLDENTIYELPFRNYFNGKWIKSCGWYPDAHPRLYNKKKARFNDSFVHERVVGQNVKTKRLNGYITHYSYDTVEDFLRKMQNYSTLFAEQNRGKKSSSVCKALIHGWFGFFKSYVLKRGFVQGYEGFIISCYNAQTAFWKYIKLYEANKR
jgi:glycosyltransferase involved in cell wall biosynthesis